MSVHACVREITIVSCPPSSKELNTLTVDAWPSSTPARFFVVTIKSPRKTIVQYPVYATAWMIIVMIVALVVAGFALVGAGVLFWRLKKLDTKLSTDRLIVSTVRKYKS